MRAPGRTTPRSLAGGDIAVAAMYAMLTAHGRVGLDDGHGPVRPHDLVLTAAQPGKVWTLRLPAMYGLPDGVQWPPPREEFGALFAAQHPGAAIGFCGALACCDSGIVRLAGAVAPDGQAEGRLLLVEIGDPRVSSDAAVYRSFARPPDRDGMKAAWAAIAAWADQHRVAAARAIADGLTA